MKNYMRRLNLKTRVFMQNHPIEWVAGCALLGYVVGRALRSLED